MMDQMPRQPDWLQRLHRTQRRPLIDETPLDRHNRIISLYGNHNNYREVVHQASNMRASQQQVQSQQPKKARK